MGDGALVLVIVAVLWVEDQKSKKIRFRHENQLLLRVLGLSLIYGDDVVITIFSYLIIIIVGKMVLIFSYLIIIIVGKMVL